VIVTLRRWQQSYLVQTLLVPAMITGAGAAIFALLAASKGDLSTLGASSFKAALGIGGFAGLTYIGGILQHGLGSASFNKDGTRNATVDNIVTIQKAADQQPAVAVVADNIAAQAAITAEQVKP
jgi:hypothetical protein